MMLCYLYDHDWKIGVIHQGVYCMLKYQKMPNIFRLSIHNVSIFMYKINRKTAPYTFTQNFEKNAHKYPTKDSHLNYKEPKIKFKRSKSKISNRGFSIWNNFIDNNEKN